MKKYFVALCLLLLNFAPSASALDYFVTVGGGRSSGNVDLEYTTDEYDSSVTSTTASATVGIKSESEFLLGAGFTVAASDSFFGAFDNYMLSQKQIFVGYRCNLAKHFRITPILGMAYWDLTVEESRLFDDSDWDDEHDFSGRNTYGQINLEFPTGRLVTVVASYIRTNYDFGHNNSAMVGVIFEFE